MYYLFTLLLILFRIYLRVFPLKVFGQELKEDWIEIWLNNFQRWIVSKLRNEFIIQHSSFLLVNELWVPTLFSALSCERHHQQGHWMGAWTGTLSLKLAEPRSSFDSQSSGSLKQCFGSLKQCCGGSATKPAPGFKRGARQLLKCRRMRDDIVEIVRCVYTVDGMSKGFTLVYIDILWGEF